MKEAQKGAGPAGLFYGSARKSELKKVYKIFSSEFKAAY